MSETDELHLIAQQHVDILRNADPDFAFSHDKEFIFYKRENNPYDFK